jgi:hypothetical protein
MSADSGLKWYAAIVVVRARIAGEWADDDLMDHQVRLFRAPDAETAYLRALQAGEGEAHSYENVDGALVTWEFCGLADLDEVRSPELQDGVEVYSWRGHGTPDNAILPKEKLAVFWRRANGHLRARDLLG